MRLGALEAGGTKMVCAIGNANGEIYESISIPTETPEITVPKMIEYFKEKDIQALGIGCFGPIDLNRKSETYGYITTTPKLAWKNYNIVGAFADALDIPVGFDTDVNGSALGEATWGITKGLDNSIYITIGTGVGMGIISNGKLLHGMLHPEGGHVLHHAALPAENRFGRRRYASGAYDAARKRRSKETAERISCNKRT